MILMQILCLWDTQTCPNLWLTDGQSQSSSGNKTTGLDWEKNIIFWVKISTWRDINMSCEWWMDLSTSTDFWFQSPGSVFVWPLHPPLSCLMLTFLHFTPHQLLWVSNIAADGFQHSVSHTEGSNNVSVSDYLAMRWCWYNGCWSLKFEGNLWFIIMYVFW